MSRNAKVRSLSKSFNEGMSPKSQYEYVATNLKREPVPFMILQKIQAAAIMN